MNSNSDDKQNNLTWEEVSTEHIVQDEWIDFRRSAYRFPDGSVFEPFYSYSRRDYVVIVASDTEGKYLCVRQFRQGIREVTTEFPAGGIERTARSMEQAAVWQQQRMRWRQPRENCLRRPGIYRRIGGIYLPYLRMPQYQTITHIFIWR